MFSFRRKDPSPPVSPGPAPIAPPAAPSATIIPMKKAASRLRGIRSLMAQHRTGYLIDIGERYIVAAQEPDAGSYLRVDPNGNAPLKRRGR